MVVGTHGSRGRSYRILAIGCVALVLAAVLYTRLTPPPRDLFRRYVLDPVPSSVGDIQVDQTHEVFGYGYVFGFKVGMPGFALLVAARPFLQLRNVRFTNGILSWEWGGSGVSASVYPSQGRVPRWLAPERWVDTKAYGICDSKEGTTDMRVLLYSERAGGAYYFVSHGH